MFIVPLKLTPNESKVLNSLINQNKAFWVERRCNFSNNCWSKKLLKITCNRLKLYQNEFLELLLTIIDNSSC